MPALTYEEALTIKPGDFLLRKKSSRSEKFVTAVVCTDPVRVRRGWDGNNYVVIFYRRVGKTPRGEIRRKERCGHTQFARCERPPFEEYKANVYADWLEERGEVRAAAMLRGQFPLDDGRSVS